MNLLAIATFPCDSQVEFNTDFSSQRGSRDSERERFTMSFPSLDQPERLEDAYLTRFKCRFVFCHKTH